MGTSLAEWTDNLFDQMETPQDATWEEDPVDFETFVRSEKHLGMPPLSAIQKRDVLEILGLDPKKLFAGGSSVNIGVLCWGKGSGKDWIAAIVQCYGIHVLRCMHNPALYFGLAQSHWIDLLNAAPSKGDAQKVYGEYFSYNIQHWPWLRTKYSLTDQRGNLLDVPNNKKGLQQLKVGGHSLELLDKRIRTASKGSDAEFAEGYAPLMSTLDEASAFRDHTETMNADKLYKTFRTSAMSRYRKNWKMFIISYPREKNDFTMRMYDMAIRKGADDKEANMYGSKHATWEVAPMRFSQTEFFEFEGLTIPIDFYDEFQDNPEDSKKMYACLPPVVEAAFFEYQDRILECVNSKRQPLIITETIEIEHEIEDVLLGGKVTKKYTGKKIALWMDKTLEARRMPRVIHVDGGRDKDRAALVMTHGEMQQIDVVEEGTGKKIPTFRYKVVVDCAIMWTPNKKKKLQVSFNNIEAIIFQLAEVYNIVKVSYDQWNSQSSLEMFQSKRILAEEHTIRDDDYLELRTMIYQHSVDLLSPVMMFEGKPVTNKAASVLYSELTTLKDTGKRIDHPKTGSKDLADCLAGCNRLLNGADVKDRAHVRQSVMPRSILGPSLSMGRSMPFSPANAGITTDVPDLVGSPKSSTPRTGMMVPGYSGYARSSKRMDGVVPTVSSAQRGYGSNMPRSILVRGTGGMGGMNTTQNFMNSPGNMQRGMLPKRLRG